MQSAPYLSDIPGRIFPRKHHTPRTVEQRHVQDTVSVGNVQPYLLKKFKERKTPDSKMVLASDWQTIRKSFQLFTKKIIDRNFSEAYEKTKHCKNSEFISELTDLLDGYCMRCGIVNHEGKKRLCLIEESSFYEDDYSVTVRMDKFKDIKNKNLRQLLVHLMSYLYNNTCITQAKNNCSRSMAEEFISNYETISNDDFDEEFLTEAKESTRLFLSQVQKDDFKIDESINQNDIEKDIKKVKTQSKEEENLLDVIKSLFAFVKTNKDELKEDDDDGYYYGTSVLITIGDCIAISNCNVPFMELYEIIESAYEGDVHICCPKKYTVINEDGSSEELNYISDFSILLNDINKHIENLTA